jgi:hypothetical protein
VAVVILLAVLVVVGLAGGVALNIIQMPPAIASIFGKSTPVVGSTQQPGTNPSISPSLSPAQATQPPQGAPQATQPPQATQAPTQESAQAAQPTTPPAPTSAPQATQALAPGATLVGTGVQIEFAGGATLSGQGRLEFRLALASGSPITNRYVRIYSQKKDLAGNWVTDRQVADGNTDNTGSYGVDLKEAHYIVSCDLTGYNWGTAGDVEGQSDVPVNTGQITQVTLRLSRISVGFLLADNKVVSNKYVHIYTEKKDLSGNLVIDHEVAGNYTDNSGGITFDLTTGDYIVSADFDGYNWGNARDVMGMAGVQLQAGQVYPLIIKLGQIRVGLVDAQNQPVTNKYVP